MPPQRVEKPRAGAAAGGVFCTVRVLGTWGSVGTCTSGTSPRCVPRTTVQGGWRHNATQILLGCGYDRDHDLLNGVMAEWVAWITLGYLSLPPGVCVVQSVLRVVCVRACDGCLL